MLILGSLILLILVGKILQWAFDDFLGFVMAYMGAAVLMAALITIPIQRVGCISDIQEYYAVKETLSTMRKGGDVAEKTAIQLKVVEVNRWIKTTQYWNNSILDIWIPDEVMELEPLQ